MNSALTSVRKAYAQARPFAATILVGAAALTIALAGARAIADISVFGSSSAESTPAPERQSSANARR
jgi:hypothetical protein